VAQLDEKNNVLYPGIRHCVQQPERVGHVVAKILSRAPHGVSHVGEPCKVDNGLHPVGFDYFANQRGITEVPSTRGPHSRPIGARSRGYRVRLAQTRSGPELWQCGFRYSRPASHEYPHPCSPKNKVSATASAGAEIALPVNFNTARLYLHCRHSYRIHTVLMQKGRVNPLIEVTREVSTASWGI